MDKTNLNETLRKIPSADKLLSDASFVELRARFNYEMVKRVLNEALRELRDDLVNGRADEQACSSESLAGRTLRIAAQRLSPTLLPVINATGVVVHTNLGRSPLSDHVASRIALAATAYSNLEYDLQEGHRGERNSHLRDIMRELTGAESVLAVNNNAAAVLLALSSLALGKEVIVSRGELIEIGGSFRVPDVMSRSGAILREVGTTNRTHPKDYRDAVNENTALILKVHTSNYRIVGFTRELTLQEIADLGRETGIPTMMDLGSGCLLDLSAYGLTEEPTVQDVLATGIDLVSFSGDKLLGGPQAGIIAGKRELVEKMRTNPLARALRMDKLTLAALEATMEAYTKPDGPIPYIPCLAMITRPLKDLQETACRLAEGISAVLGHRARIEITSGAGRVGGGALPMEDLPGPRVSIRPLNVSAARLEKTLRLGNPPVIVLVQNDRALIDPRTLLSNQAEMIPELLSSALDRAEKRPIKLDGV
jgi:L-seryl-tRNA(Ser) seleniumtransferase